MTQQTANQLLVETKAREMIEQQKLWELNEFLTDFNISLHDYVRDNIDDNDVFETFVTGENLGLNAAEQAANLADLLPELGE